MSLFLIKILVTVSIVLGLSVIAERVSPRWAGLLGGYPLSVAIVLIFIAIEEGLSFGAESAVHTIAGLSANLSIFAAYGLVLSLRPQTHFIVCILCALATFFAIGYGLGQIAFTVETALPFIIAVIFICLFAFKKIADMKIKQAVRLSFWVTLMRAASACFVVLAITAMAETLGAQMAGVMASFPATVLPMVVIIHVTYGPAPVLAIIKHFPAGLGATVVFCLVYTLYLQELGMLLGTLLSFGIATLYLLSYSAWQQKRRPC